MRVLAHFAPYVVQTFHHASISNIPADFKRTAKIPSFVYKTFHRTHMLHQELKNDQENTSGRSVFQLNLGPGSIGNLLFGLLNLDMVGTWKTIGYRTCSFCYAIHRATTGFWVEAIAKKLPSSCDVRREQKRCHGIPDCFAQANDNSFTFYLHFICIGS